MLCGEGYRDDTRQEEHAPDPLRCPRAVWIVILETSNMLRDAFRTRSEAREALAEHRRRGWPAQRSRIVRYELAKDGT